MNAPHTHVIAMELALIRYAKLDFDSFFYHQQHTVLVINVTEGQGMGFPLAAISMSPSLTFIVNKRKIEPKQLHSCSIPRLLIA